MSISVRAVSTKERMFGKEAVILAALILTVGCASSSQNIAPSYISPIVYENFTCEQLSAEAQTVSSRASQAAGVQDKSRTQDAVITTVGAIVFWPVLFALDGDGPQAAELARLKGQMEAIEQASIRKNCGIQFKQAPPPAKKKSTSQN